MNPPQWNKRYRQMARILCYQFQRIWDVPNDPSGNLQKVTIDYAEKALLQAAAAEIDSTRNGDICPACATEFEDGTFKKCGGTIIKEVTFLRDEITRLKRVIARELVEEDGLGMEFTYVGVLKEECERLREAWNKIDNLAQTLLDDGHERSPD